MAQIKKAKDSLCYQIVDLYQFRDFILKSCDDAIREEVERKLAEIILQNRMAYKSLF